LRASVQRLRASGIGLRARRKQPRASGIGLRASQRRSRASTNHPIASCEGLRASQIWLRATGFQSRARRDGLALVQIRSRNASGRPAAATFAKSMGVKREIEPNPVPQVAAQRGFRARHALVHPREPLHPRAPRVERGQVALEAFQVEVARQNARILAEGHRGLAHQGLGPSAHLGQLADLVWAQCGIQAPRRSASGHSSATSRVSLAHVKGTPARSGRRVCCSHVVPHAPSASSNESREGGRAITPELHVTRANWSCELALGQRRQEPHCASTRSVSRDTEQSICNQQPAITSTGRAQLSPPPEKVLANAPSGGKANRLVLRQNGNTHSLNAKVLGNSKTGSGWSNALVFG
jgi:hypothetical protein